MSYMVIVIDENNVRWALEKLIKSVPVFVKESEAKAMKMDFGEALRIYEKYETQKNELVGVIEC